MKGLRGMNRSLLPSGIILGITAVKTVLVKSEKHISNRMGSTPKGLFLIARGQPQRTGASLPMDHTKT